VGFVVLRYHHDHPMKQHKIKKPQVYTWKC
jgi:hypothetical protein